MTTKRWHVLFSGRVQGVGFRYTCIQCSKGQAVTGWVKNLSDGRVEMVAEATRETLDAYLAEIESSNHGSIRDVKITKSNATGQFETMKIQHS